MAFAPRWTSEASGEYNRLKDQAESSLQNRRNSKKAKASRAEGLFKQVEKCIRFLLENPKHPGLHTHKYDSIVNPHDSTKPVFEAHAQNKTPAAYRVFWCYGPGKGEITIIAITRHP
ncbi:MAG TPA: hypothetical protein VMT52_02735 [Planctomycetota bacterium]|nr:hypothetical protein [Planctomycetota bacterium]